MKLHIENISITISSPPPVGMIAGMALASAAKGDLPAIGEKWPGTEATYRYRLWRCAVRARNKSE